MPTIIKKTLFARLYPGCREERPRMLNLQMPERVIEDEPGAAASQVYDIESDMDLFTWVDLCSRFKVTELVHFSSEGYKVGLQAYELASATESNPHAKGFKGNVLICAVAEKESLDKEVGQ